MFNIRNFHVYYYELSYLLSGIMMFIIRNLSRLSLEIILLIICNYHVSVVFLLCIKWV